MTEEFLCKSPLRFLPDTQIDHILRSNVCKQFAGNIPKSNAVALVYI